MTIVKRQSTELDLPGSPIPGEPLTVIKARELWDDVKANFRTAGASMGRGCLRLAEFYDRRGGHAMGWAQNGSPVPYICKALGLTRQRLYQVIAAGRVLSTSGRQLPILTERAVRPLVPLLDEPEKLQEACQAAQELADREARERAQRNGKAPPRKASIEPRHIAKAAAAHLPPRRPEPIEDQPQAHATLAEQLIKQVRKIHDRAAAADAPGPILRALNQAAAELESWRAEL